MCFCFFFFKQKTAYEMRISDWSSDVCSSDLGGDQFLQRSAGEIVRLLELFIELRGEIIGQLSVHSLGGHRLATVELERSEEHTSELQSLMRISYAVFCLKKKNKNITD